MRRTWKRIVTWFDYACLAITPFALILIVVALIVLVERGTALERQMVLLEAMGRRARATVAGEYDPAGDLLALAWTDSGGRAYYDAVRAAHYPREAVRRLREGDQVGILYVPGDGDPRAVLADYVDYYRRPVVHCGDVLALLLGAWIPLAVRPDILYLGFTDDLEGLVRRTVVREG